VTEMMSKMP